MWQEEGGGGGVWQLARRGEEDGRQMEEDKEDKEVDKEAAHQTPIVRRLIRSAQSLDSANVQHISQVILSAGVNWQQLEEKEEAALQTLIAQLPTRCALNSVSASVSATSLAIQSVGAKEKQFAVAVVRLEEETQAAILTPIVLPLTQFALSLAFASAAAMRREMRSVGGEETLCAVDQGATRILGWGIFSPLNICQALLWDASQLSCVSQSYKS